MGVRNVRDSLDAVLLDAGGVLVWPNWNRVAEALAKQGVVADPALLARADPHARHALDTADVVAASTELRRLTDYFDLVLSGAGVQPSHRTEAALVEVAEYQRVMNLWEDVPEFVPRALTTLRDDGLRLAIVSNANGTLQACLKRLGLAPFFEVIIDSTEEGVRKPDPRIFEMALQRLGVEADRAIHVGDMYSVDVVGAQAAGLRAVLVDEAHLWGDVDCERIPSIAALPGLLGRPAAKFR